jgi:transcriptional regulator with GAF, ATPase, and Fis domain
MTTQTDADDSRQALISQTFLQLADTLVDDFDIIDLLMMLADRCVELVDADAAGILLVDAEENLRVMAASSEEARLLELFQLQSNEGPCMEAYATGQPVVHPELRTTFDRWPHFTPYAVGAGFESACALPLRLRGNVIGALNLFRFTSGPLPGSDVKLAQALADVASIAVLQAQATRESLIHNGQLQHALNSRVTIEQAKGMVAQSAQIDMAEAFDRIRTYARNNNLQLTSVAQQIIGNELTLDADPSVARGR